MTALALTRLTALTILLSIAVVTDVRERRIPNRLTLSGGLLGIVLGALAVGGFPVSSLAGAAIALIVAFPFFALGGLGAGDAKLLAMVGTFVGPAGLLPVVLYGGIAGGLLALGSSLRRGTIIPLLLRSRDLFVYLVTFGSRGTRWSLDDPGAEAVPYGVAIAVGALGAWFFPIVMGGAS
jgi:prepilin peptidase CpaA